MTTMGSPDPNTPPTATLDPLLLLAGRGAGNGTVDSVARHFYQGLARITGMHDSFDCAFDQLWACAEELRLLFDAEAIWIRSTSRRSIREGTSEVASLTEEEKKLLKPYLWGGRVPQDAKQCQCGAGTWLGFPGHLGELVDGLTNSNLTQAASLLRIGVNSPESWEMALVLPGEKPARRASHFYEWLLNDREGVRCDALLAGLRTIGLRFGVAAKKRERLWDLDREKLSDELKGLELEDFKRQYAERMRPMHGILNALHKNFTDLMLKGKVNGEEREHRIVFSYRKVNENCICFMPTDQQAKNFVQKREQIAEFLEFCRFPYPRGKALSGWVLSTGMCDYTENFDLDGRWTSWIDNERSTELGDKIEKQLWRVQSFLQRSSSLEIRSKLPHVYLVPIVHAPSEDDGRHETILMASISVATPLSMEARLDLFDLAVKMKPTVVAVLDAQQTSDDLKKLEAERKRGDVAVKEPDKPEGNWWSRALEIVKQVPAIHAAWLVIVPGLLYLASLLHLRDSPTPPPTPRTAIVLGVNPIPLSAMTILATKGDYYGRYHLQAATKQFATGRDALDALLAGDAQFVTVAETPLVFASFANQKLAVVATMAESKEEMQLVVNSDRIHTLADLKSSTLATALGTNADYFADAFLTHHGMRRSQIKVINLKPVEMVDAFAKGSIDGYFVWQPFVYKGLHMPNVHATSYSGSDFYTMTFNIVTSQDFVKNHPDQVQEFLRALKDAEDEIKRDPSEGEDAVEEKTGIDRETLDKLWPNYDFGLKLDQSFVTILDDQRQWVQRSDSYRGAPTPDLRALLVPGPLQAVKPGSVNLH